MMVAQPRITNTVPLRESAGQSVDLTSPASFNGGMVGATNLVPFDSLVGLDVLRNASLSLFSCNQQRSARRGRPAPPPRRAPWPHRRVFARTAPLVTYDDIAVGVNVAARRPLVNSRERASVHQLCELKNLGLACAAHTYMRASPSLAVLALVDCQGLTGASAGASSTATNTAAASVTKGTTTNNASSSGAGGPRYDFPLSAGNGTAATFDMHTAFPFATPAWVAERAGSLRLRCYWGLAGGHVRGAGSHRKTAVLLRALLEELPRKRFYLKVDEDTLVRPTNLLHFLNGLAATASGAAHAAATNRAGDDDDDHYEYDPPLYFGSARSGEDCADDSCRMFTFNTFRSRGGGARVGAVQLQEARPLPVLAQPRIANTVPLRESVGWQALEARFMPDGAQRNATSGIGIVGLSGGAYGLSRAALVPLVRSRCLHEVGELKCGVARSGITRSCRPCRFRRGPVHAMEDNTVGLCMHLLRVRPIHCEAFRSFASSDPPALDDARPREEKLQRGRSTVVRRSSQALSRWLVTLHPLKDARAELLAWWRALERRERSDAQDLARWREQTRANE